MTHPFNRLSIVISASPKFSLPMFESYQSSTNIMDKVLEGKLERKDKKECMGTISYVGLILIN